MRHSFKVHVMKNMFRGSCHTFKKRFTDFASIKHVVRAICFIHLVHVLLLVTLPPTSSHFSTWKAPLLRMRFWHCKMALRWKPDQHPVNLKSMWCSGNYKWRISVPISEVVPFLDQLICAKSAFSCIKIIKSMYRYKWLITTLQPAYALQPAATFLTTRN